MKDEYVFGIDIIQISKKEENPDKYGCCIFGDYIIFNAKRQKTIEKKIANHIFQKKSKILNKLIKETNFPDISDEEIGLQNQVELLEQIASMINEKGLDNAEKSYQTLQLKCRGENK